MAARRRFIDDRVLLEAERLPVRRTGLSVTAVGGRPGLPGARVFTTSIGRRAGRTPAAFRMSGRGTRS